MTSRFAPGFLMQIRGFLLVLVVGILAGACESTGIAQRGDSLSAGKGCWLRFTIHPGFEPGVRYEVREDEPGTLVYTEFAGQSMEGQPVERRERHIALSQIQMDTLEAKLKRTLDNLPEEDGIQGFDGALWVMEANMSEPVEHSVWMPGFNMEKRGYTHFVDLFMYLREIVDQRKGENNQ